MTVGNARVITISTMSTPIKKRKLFTMSPLTPSSAKTASSYTKDGYIVQAQEGVRMYGKNTRKPRNKSAQILKSIIGQACPTFSFKREYFGGAYVNGSSDVAYRGGFTSAGKVVMQFCHGVVNKSVNATQTVEDGVSGTTPTYASGTYTALGYLSHSGMTMMEINRKLEYEALGSGYPAVMRGKDDRNPFGTPIFYKGGSYTHTFTNESAKVLQFCFTEYTPVEDKTVTDSLNSPVACFEKDNEIVTGNETDFGTGQGYINSVFPVRTSQGTLDQRKNFGQSGNYMRANYLMLSKRKVELKPGAKVEFTVKIPPFSLSNARWKNKLYVGYTTAGGIYNSITPNVLAGVTKFLCVTVQSELGRNNMSRTPVLGTEYEPTADTEFTAVGRGGTMFSHTCIENVSAMYLLAAKQNVRIQNYDLDVGDVDAHVTENQLYVDDTVVGPKSDTAEDTTSSTSRLR